MQDNNIVSLTSARRTLERIISRGIVKMKPLLLGAPGVGKTSIINQVAAQYGYTVQTVMLSQMMPEHITGYPYIDQVKSIMKYARAHWWPDAPKTILFLDEIGQCPIAVQNVAMQLINERRVGPHVLPDDCIVIGAGNRAEDRAGSTVLTTTIRSRFYPVLTVEPTKDEWLDHAKESNFNPVLVAYVERIRSNVVEFDPKHKGGFVTLRTLEQASDLFAMYDSDHENPDLRAALHGTIGGDAANECLAFAETVAKLPSIAQIKDTPNQAPVVPDMVQPVAAMINSHARFGNLSSIVAYIKRYDTENQAVLVRAIPDAMASRHPDVKELKADLGL